MENETQCRNRLGPGGENRLGLSLIDPLLTVARMDSAQRLLLELGKELSPTKLLGVFRPAMQASKADVDCRATHRQEEQGGHVSLQSTRRSPLRLRYRSVQLSGEPNHFLIE